MSVVYLGDRSNIQNITIDYIDRSIPVMRIYTASNEIVCEIKKDFPVETGGLFLCGAILDLTIPYINLGNKNLEQFLKNSFIRKVEQYVKSGYEEFNVYGVRIRVSKVKNEDDSPQNYFTLYNQRKNQYNDIGEFVDEILKLKN